MNDISFVFVDFLEQEKLNLFGLLGFKILVFDFVYLLKNKFDWDFEIVYKQLVY